MERTVTESALNPADFPPLPMTERVLMGPGPDGVHPRVMSALSAPVLGHLDPAFLKIMDGNVRMLRYLFQTQNRLTIPISGTGSAGMEAAVASVIEPGDPVLILANGYFGLRMAEMARRQGADVTTLTKPWGEVFSPEEIRAALKSKAAKVVGMVHAETSTGALQPLDDIVRVAHGAGALVIVDTVTSLGGVPVNVDETGIDICYSGTQKCIGCPPGLAPITVGPRAEERMAARKGSPSTWYLDLSMLSQYWGPERTYHHTAPVNMNYGLYEALRMIVEETLPARWARHRRNAEMLWAGLEEMGFSMHVPLAHRLPSLTTVRIPDGVDELGTRQKLLSEYGIEIGGGLGELKGKVWRIGLMAHTSSPENVVLLLGALKRILGR
jgi:alanine-glyoxylate transaminase / serine-glyoxylate transaminase / serine-pyruvate transaminase